MSVPAGSLRNVVAVLERLRNTLGGWNVIVTSADGDGDNRISCHAIKSHLDAIGISVACFLGEDADKDEDEEETPGGDGEEVI